MCAMWMVPAEGLWKQKEPRVLDSTSLNDRVAVPKRLRGYTKYVESATIGHIKSRDMFDISPAGSGDLSAMQQSTVVFKCRLLQLIAKLFPELDVPSPPTIFEIGSGSSNFVVGITIPPPKKGRGSSNTALGSIAKFFNTPASTQPQEFAMRVPLTGDRESLVGVNGEINRNVAILKVIGSRLTVPVPKVVHYDLNDDNLLIKPYVLQTKLQGHCLCNIWMSFSPEQKLSAMRQLTKATENIASVPASTAGLISVDNLDSLDSSEILLNSFPMPKLPHDVSFEGLGKISKGRAHIMTPVEQLLDFSKRWRDYEQCKGIEHNVVRWKQIVKIIELLELRGWLGNSFHLVHDDLFPRNILAAAKNDSTVEITGIVDWDSCFFAPKFMAFRPPYWAWTDRSALERDETNATHEPPDNTSRLMKKAFEDSASAEFKRFALSEEAVLARKLWYILQDGMLLPKTRNDAIDVIHRWDRLFPGDRIRVIPCDSATG